MRLIKGFASLALVCGAVFSLAGCGGSTSNQTASEPSVTGIAVSPLSTPLTPGQTQALTVTATESSGATIPLTDGLTFTSDNTAIATVSAAGVVTAGKAAGTAHIAVTAVVGVNNILTAPVPAAIVVTIPAPTLTSIALSPLTASLLPGGSKQLIVNGTYSDNSVAELPAAGETFASSNAAVATVNAAGIVTVASGATAGQTATISATDTASGLTTATANSTVVTVSMAAPTLASIAISPANISLAPGGTQTLTVTGTYSSGPPEVLPNSGETFTSSNTSVATVSTSGIVTVASGATIGQTAQISAKDNASQISTTTPATVTVATQGADGRVFYNGAYDTNVGFVTFGGAINSPAPAVDPTTVENGSASLKVNITQSANGYSGGALAVPTANARDLHTFNALTFYASASASGSTLKVGIGNDGTAPVPVYSAELAPGQVPLTTSFQQFVLPLPDPSKYTSTDGLFHYADGSSTAGYNLWFNNIQYQTLAAGSIVGPTTASIAWPPAQSITLGGTYQMNNLLGTVTFTTPAVTETAVAWRWFTLASDNTSVATVSPDGLITASATNTGTAHITATLAGLPSGTTIAGNVTVTVTSAALPVPTTAPPVPTQPVANVISLYSSVPGGYNGTAADHSAAVTEWLTCWSPSTGGTPVSITAGATSFMPRKYVMPSTANYAGIDIGIGGDTCPAVATPVTDLSEIDISAMTYFHVDAWTPDDSSNLQFKLVDAGTDGIFVADPQGFFGIDTIAPVTTGQWVSYDVPLSTVGFPGNTFPGGNATQLHHFGQIVIVAPNGGTVYLDNLYFYNKGTVAASGPTTAAATPTPAAANVKAIYDSSGVYTPLASVTLNENWCGGATEAAYLIPGSNPAQNVAMYSWTNTCDGIGFESNPINATSLGLTNFHIDLWSSSPGPLNLQLVDGASNSTGTYSPPTIAANTWTSIDVPLSSFTGLTGETAIQQVGLVNGPTSYTLYVDNIYLYKASGGGGGGPTAPTASPAAPTATAKAAIYSPTYGATVAAPVWSYNVGFCGANTYAPYSISGGDQVLQYGVTASAPCFAWADATLGGSVGSTIDASAFSTLHVDIWTPAAPPVIDIGVVDFTGSTIRTDYYLVYGSGPAAACVPSAWCSLEIPVNSGSPLSPNKALGQMLLVAQATNGNNITTGTYTFFIDNFYYH